MRDKYLCVKCAEIGKVIPAEEVHHIIHLSPKNINDPSISLNMDNLISLCREHHFEEHRGEHGRGRQVQEAYPYEFDENGMLRPKSQ